MHLFLQASDHFQRVTQGTVQNFATQVPLSFRAEQTVFVRHSRSACRPAQSRNLSSTCRLLSDLYQIVRGRSRRHRHWLEVLRVAPVVQDPDLLYARHRAPRPAELIREVFAMPHFRRVLRKRNPRVPALLGAPVHQPVLANVQVTRTRAAAPLMLLAARYAVLKIIE